MKVIEDLLHFGVLYLSCTNSIHVLFTVYQLGDLVGRRSLFSDQSFGVAFYLTEFGVYSSDLRPLFNYFLV